MSRNRVQSVDIFGGTLASDDGLHDQAHGQTIPWLALVTDAFLGVTFARDDDRLGQLHKLFFLPVS